MPGWSPTAAQVGYGVGIFFFVPLGDLMERRRLVLMLTAVCGVLLIFTAVAPSLSALVFFQLLVGISAVGAQILIPLAIDLSPAEKRGHTVGILMAGLLVGILLARTVSGFLGDIAGWQATYLMSAGVMVVMWFVLRASLPHRAPSLRMSYGRLMHSMLDLLLTQPKLWVASIVSGLTFAAFTGFWTTLSFLMQVRFHRGASEAGMFGIVGIAGALGGTDRREIVGPPGTGVHRLDCGSGIHPCLCSDGILGHDSGADHWRSADGHGCAISAGGRAGNRHGARSRCPEPDEHDVHGCPVPGRSRWIGQLCIPVVEI